MDEKEQDFRINCQGDHEGNSTNPRERLLIILAFIFLVLVLSLLCAIVISIAVESLLPKSGMCLSKDCVKKAGDILGNLNEEVNPCENFYSYSCGGWKNKNLLSLPGKSIFQEIQMKVYDQMYAFIQKINKDDGGIADKVAKITESCINHSTLVDKKPLKMSYDKLFKSYGGFPLANVEEAGMTKIVKIANLYRLLGTEPIIRITVIPSDKDNKKNVLVIAPPDPSVFSDPDRDIELAKKFLKSVYDIEANPILLKFDYVKTLYNNIKDKLAVEFKYKEEFILSNDKNKITTLLGNFDFDEFISILLTKQEEKKKKTFKKLIPSITVTPSTSTERTSESSSTEQFSDTTPTTDQLSTITIAQNKQLKRRRRNGDQKNAGNENSVIEILVINPEVVKTVLELFLKENDETISNFLSIQFLKNIEDNNVMGLSNTQLSKHTISKYVEDGKIMKCLQDLSEHLIYAFDYIYINNTNVPSKEARDVVDHVKKALKSFVPAYSWLDDEHKKFVDSKLNEMNYFVGYPLWLSDKAQVQDYYKDLNLNIEKSALVRRGSLDGDGSDENTGYADAGDGKDDADAGDEKDNDEENDADEEQPVDVDNPVVNDDDIKAKTTKPYIEIYMDMVKFNKKKLLEKLSVTNDRSSWPNIPAISITTVNAFYSSQLNSIVVPAAILNPPIFDVNIPFYLNFGSLGTVIGHEITHGFDTNGRKRDKDGNIPEHSLWNQDTIKNYNSEAKCFEDQYSTYSIGTLKVNGTKTLAENIADNGAINEALSGYRYWLSEHNKGRKENSLPGLDSFTHEQLFFISYAQSWCHTANRKYLKELIETDEHTPNQFRVKGSLSNSKEFSEVFECENGKPMNPTKKCKLW
uniref:Endothelin-converting enzyme 1 n=1 Tax=Tityus serrulatus TaxID=6887 RepID=A0A076L7Z9_TITSE|nr:endothelin-converting enzyme 1 [Tityus serrulatus]